MKGEPVEDISFLGNTFTPHRIATLHSYGGFDGAGGRAESVISFLTLEDALERLFTKSMRIVHHLPSVRFFVLSGITV